jgi:hypothetical protein
MLTLIIRADLLLHIQSYKKFIESLILKVIHKIPIVSVVKGKLRVCKTAVGNFFAVR